jgi:membrane-associated phospholipid phosphatase
MIKKIIKKWKILAQDKAFVKNLLLSKLFLIVAMVTLKLSGLRADTIPAPSLPDLFHSIIPLTNVMYIATYGFIAVQLLLWGYFIVYEPRRLPYAMKVYGIFIIFRSIFISLTTLGAPAVRLDLVPVIEAIFGGIYFTQDLFPSGHTGSAFVGYLVARKKWMKKIMLFCTVMMGMSVLLLRVHYSIDVLGALFVAYGARGFYHEIRKRSRKWEFQWPWAVPAKA